MLKIKNKLASVFREDFAKYVATLLTGTAVAQIIALLALPVLTRLYTPNDFSILAAYVAVLAIMSSIVGLRFEIAIPIPKSKKMALAVLSVTLINTIIVTALFTVVLLVFYEKIHIWTNHKLVGYLWLLPIGTFFIGVYTALQYWETRNKNFKLIAKTKLIQSINGSVVQIALGIGGCSPLGLLVGYTIQTGSGVYRLVKSLVKNERKVFLLILFRVSYLRLVWKRFDRFPKFSTLESLTNIIGTHGPILVIVAVESIEAGFLILAMRLLTAPLGLLGNAIAQVYLVQGAENYREGQLKRFTYTVLWKLIKIGTFPLLLIGVLAPFFIPLILGPDWERTGYLMLIMVPWYLSQFISSPISMALHICNAQVTALILQVFGLSLRLGSVFFCVSYISDYIVESYVISSFAFYLIYILVILSVINKKELYNESR